MNQQKYLQRISELLARYRIQVGILNHNAQLDINVLSEDILIPILNIIYKCDLANANKVNYANYPALDLVDNTNKIAFQITSTSKISKITSTLRKIVTHNLYNDYDTYYVYIIKEKEKSYNQSVLDTATSGHFDFPKNHILDYKNLYSEISTLDLDDVIKIKDLLEKQFSDIQTSNHLDLLDFNLTKNDELKSLSKIRATWIRKKNFYKEEEPLLLGHQLFVCQENIKNCEAKVLEIEQEIISKLS